ncbi:MAG: NAD(P)-dependent oxidoreductase, partial [Burkholderiaceae bacterium]
DAIIHLGGQSVEAAWDIVLDANIKGTYHLFEAARQAGVSRIVFASTNHVVGFYERDQVIDSNVKVRPDSRYGVSKAFGEALGALYACKHGIRVTNLRIGNVGLLPLDKRRLSIWIHPEDLMQLIWIGLTHEAIENEVLYGASDNARSWWDNSRAVQLGYQPKHQSEQFAAQILASEQADDPIAEKFQGGTFCADEFSRR